MIVCAGRNEIFDFAKPIGVGLVESSINLTKLIISNKPDSFLFVGSAGSYGKHNIFDIIHSKTASNIELGYLENKCYTPLKNTISTDNLDNVPRETKNIINSSNYITTNKHSSNEFLKLGLSAENMEFFSIVSVGREFGIPVSGIFIITNYCYENAHEEFISNHTKAKQLLTQYTKDYLAKN
ncbi:purine-nucleoside phosphorylase [Sulfurospirillum sp. 1307]|jgi:nucleoside phosphorylase